MISSTLSRDSSSVGETWALALIWAIVALGGLVLIREGWRTARGRRDKGGPDGG